MGKPASILNLLLILGIMLGMSGAKQLQRVEPLRMQTSLVKLAFDEPDTRVGIIVQKSGLGDDAEHLVAAHGGKILHELKLINAFSAEIDAGMLTRLAQDDSVSWISLDAPVQASDISNPPPHITLLADFNEFDFGADVISWRSEWFEIGEADGPQNGDVSIESFWAGNYQGLRLTGQGRGVKTNIDLKEAAGAMFGLAMRRKDFSQTDYVCVQISFDDVNWVDLGRITGTVNDDALNFVEFDLTAYSGEVVFIRLLSDLGDTARFYLDYAQLDYTTVSPKETPVFSHQVHLPLVVNTRPSEGAAEYEGMLGVEMLNSSGTIKDAFQEPGFNNNDGSLNWVGGWIEIDEAGEGPENGNIVVATSYLNNTEYRELRLSNQLYSQIPPAIERKTDLSGGLTGAVLSFNYRSENVEAGDKVAVQLSQDGGASYQTLEVFEVIDPFTFSPSANQRRYDISEFTGSDVIVRFQLEAGYDQAGEFFYVDDVQIAYTTLGTQTVRDEFNSATYSAQDGLATWSEPWLEYDPYGGNGAFGGYVRVYNGQLRFHYLWNEYIQRTLNLKGATSARLTFDWETMGLDSFEALSVWVATPDSQPTIVADLTGSDTGSMSIDLSAYISSKTRIIFGNHNQYWEYGENVYIDNLQVSYGSPCPECIDLSNLESAFIPSVGANLLWNDGPGYLQGQGITIAVVDSGIADHQDFYDSAGNSRVLTHVNFSGAAELPDDFYGHGTHVAGLIAGNGSFSDGEFMGVAPKANLVDVKVLDDTGRGLTSEVVAGLEWIYDNADTYNIRIVNLSLNSSAEESYRYSALNTALEMLWFRGITVVVAAGNNGDDADAGIVYPPANDPYLITVGASDDQDTNTKTDDTLAPFSAYGTTVDGYSKPDIVAPGTNMTSVKSGDDTTLYLEHPGHVIRDRKGNKYFQMSGTSMASPVVAGAVALLLQTQPSLTPDQVKATLVANGEAFLYSEGIPFGNGAPYLNITQAVANPVFDAAPQGYIPNDLLAKMAMIAYWANTMNEGEIDWKNVDWNAVDWDAVDWAAVNWGNVNWGSVNWGSVNWGSVNWGSVNWGSVNWGSVNWGSVNWGSVNWGSVNWGSVNWGSDNWSN